MLAAFPPVPDPPDEFAALATISSCRLAASALTSNRVATDGVSTDRVAAGVAAGARRAVSASTAPCCRIAAGCGRITATTVASAATVAAYATNCRANRSGRSCAARAALGAGARSAVLTGFLFDLSGVASRTSRNLTDDGNRAKTAFTRVSTGAAVARTRIRSAPGPGSRSTGDAVAASRLAGLASDIATTNGRAAGNCSTDSHAARRNAASRAPTVGVSTKGCAAESIAAVISGSIGVGNCRTCAEIANAGRPALST